MTLRGTGHELGHNLGVHHASSLTCTDASAPVVAQTSCSDDSDCGVGMITLTCCGSQQATGVNAFDICGFMGAAGGCVANACDCAAQAEVADDGSHAADVTVNAVVACLQGVCTTSFTP